MYGTIGNEYSIPMKGGSSSSARSTDGSSVSHSTFPEDELERMAETKERLSREGVVELWMPNANENDSLLLPGPSSTPNIDLSTSSSWQNSLSNAFFSFLGFQANPFRLVPPTSTNQLIKHVAQRNSAAADLRLSMLSNFSTAYNIISISLALRIMNNMYHITPEQSAQCSSALIAGMIVGQIAGGTLGDVFGRHRAMAVVMCLQIFAAIGSASALQLATVGLDIFQVLAFWRFVLGVGCGGVYPLSATMTAETPSLSPQDRTKAVALAFSFQGVGYLFVPATAWVLLECLGELSDLAWRLLLGLGAVPGALLTIKRLKSRSATRTSTASDENIPSSVVTGRGDPPAGATPRVVPVSLWRAICLEKHLIVKFLGTGGCWFLFDVLFYGNALFQPVVLAKAFGSVETVQKAARDTLLIGLISLPGYLASNYAIGRLSPRFIQLQGFFIMGILYLCIGILFEALSEDRIALILVYSGTFFFSNFGPNATTFLLPSMTFSRSCRSTLNGISAASGKLGALVGASVFVTASSQFGPVVVFLACALFAFLGSLLTLLCVSGSTGLQEERTPIVVPPPEQHPGGEITIPTTLLARQDSHFPMRVVYSGPSLVDYA